ncbi:lipase [gamma proteobacterium HTCC5015]|nr:lipase [gamma proteobacterium HTCC5015]
MLKKIAIVAVGLFLFNGHAQAMGEEPATYTKTDAPIVLVNGLFGFDDILGVDYWYGIVDDLRDNGATVYVVNVQATNSIAARGEQLIASLEQFRALDGHKSFNLIGHSYGAPTSRYAAAVRPELVSSVSTVGGVNKGTDLADGLYNLDQYPVIGDAVWALGDLLGIVIDGISGQGDATNQDIKEAARQMTYAGMAEWNQSFPQGVPTSACGEGDHQVNGIRYYSWSGVAQRTNLVDLTDLVVDVTSLFFDNKDHDGLVPRCSSHLGDVIRDDYYLNHLDEVNQMTGLKSIRSPDPVQIIRNHANRMKNAGL